MKHSEGISNIKSGEVEYYDEKFKDGTIIIDGETSRIINSPIAIKKGDKVTCIINAKKIVTDIGLGAWELFEVFNEFSLDVERKYLWKEYKEVENNHWNVISQVLDHHKKAIDRGTENIAQYPWDNIQLKDFLTKFIKATLPEAFKNIIKITNLNKENLRMTIPKLIYHEFSNNPKINKIMNDFKQVMIRDIPNILDENYSCSAELILYVYKEIWFRARVAIQYRMNDIDLAVIEFKSETKHENKRPKTDRIKFVGIFNLIFLYRRKRLILGIPDIQHH